VEIPVSLYVDRRKHKVLNISELLRTFVGI
jgi:hypothetical protein